jgi:hypothetical protein
MLAEEPDHHGFESTALDGVGFPPALIDGSEIPLCFGRGRERDVGRLGARPRPATGHNPQQDGAPKPGSRALA